MNESSAKVLRVRWAAIGAAIAVALGAGGLGIARASISSGERNVFVAIKPCRLIDTRPAPDTVGTRTMPLGSGETVVVAVRGTHGDCTIPADATALAANVVAVLPSASGFFTLFPSDASKPVTSNLNFVAGAPPTPNKVDVKLSADGNLSVFNFTGTTHLVLDVFGYYADHNHDDRYQLKGNYQPAGSYQPAGNYMPGGDIVMRQGASSWVPNGGSNPTIRWFSNGVEVQSDGDVQMSIDGPASIGALEYRLASVTWCLSFDTSASRVIRTELDTRVEIVDLTPRTTEGCYTIEPDPADSLGIFAVLLITVDVVGIEFVAIGDVTSVWEPVP